MTQFSDIQRSLETARQEAFQLSRQLFKERQRLQRCKRDRKRLERFVTQLPTPSAVLNNSELAVLDQRGGRRLVDLRHR